MGKLRFRKPKNANEFLGIPPIGIILAFSKDVRPAQIYGGDWERCGQGKVIVGVNENDSDFIAPAVIENNGNITSVTEKTGGEKQHTLSIEEMPSHRHSYGEPRHTGGDWSCLGDTCNMNQSLDPDNSNVFHGYTFYTGGSQAHNNLQPYMTAYFWRRIA